MKSSDRTVLFVVAGLAVIAGLWFGLISPKRSELAKVEEEVATTRAEVSEQEQIATTAAAAKETYRTDYRNLITLGKAVPGDDDVASLIDQIDGLANEAGVTFSGLKLSENAASAAPAAPAPTEGAVPEGESADSGDAATPASATPVPATEAAVADLPLGATVGPAGLPTMPYDLTFSGTFFEIADFLAGLDGLVRVDDDGIGVDGRLITVDGFNISPDTDAGFPHLIASLHVTTFVAPADQGATAGADPSAPAPVTAPATPTAPSTTPPTASVAAPTP